MSLGQQENLVLAGLVTLFWCYWAWFSTEVIALSPLLLALCSCPSWVRPLHIAAKWPLVVPSLVQDLKKRLSLIVHV